MISMRFESTTDRFAGWIINNDKHPLVMKSNVLRLRNIEESIRTFIVGDNAYNYKSIIDCLCINLNVSHVVWVTCAERYISQGNKNWQKIKDQLIDINGNKAEQSLNTKRRSGGRPSILFWIQSISIEQNLALVMRIYTPINWFYYDHVRGSFYTFYNWFVNYE